MTISTDNYLAFLSEVEAALTEALDSGRLALGADKRDELRDMRREVAAAREAMAARRTGAPLPLVAVR